MNIYKIYSAALVTSCALFLFSCSGNKSRSLVGTWRAVKLENPEMDSFFKNSQAYIDTVGKSNDAATNIAQFGVANMDSMRHVLQGQYDSAKAMQEATVTNTVFTFRKDSVVVLSFNGAIDSSKWTFDGTKALILSDLNGSTANDKVKMEVLSLTDSALKLKFEENGSFSVVTFHPQAK